MENDFLWFMSPEIVVIIAIIILVIFTGVNLYKSYQMLIPKTIPFDYMTLVITFGLLFLDAMLFWYFGIKG